MSDLIRLNRVSCIFGEGDARTIALNKVNLTISEGESVSISGESGSGKSTLLSVIGLLEDLSSGEFLLQGVDVKSLSFEQKSIIRNKHIGWIFQNFGLLNNLSAIENVCLPLRFNKETSKKDYQKLSMQALEKVGLLSKSHALPAQLSGGQQQRVAIARAIVTNPSLILADEPTGNLDSSTGEEIFSLLMSLCQQGNTLILVTHNNDLAMRCRKQLKMNDGQLQCDN